MGECVGRVWQSRWPCSWLRASIFAALDAIPAVLCPWVTVARKVVKLYCRPARRSRPARKFVLATVQRNACDEGGRYILRGA